MMILRHFARIILCCIGLVLLAGQGQGDGHGQVDLVDLRGLINQVNSEIESEAVSVIDANAELVAEALTRALVRQHEYAESSFDHRRALFDWQLWSSYMIFAVVVFIVFVGLYFSWLQFSDTRRHLLLSRQRAAAGKAVSGDDLDSQTLASTVEAGPEGIKVTSPVLGVIILMISVAFFYLYLVHVYPITAVEKVIDTTVVLPD